MTGKQGEFFFTVPFTYPLGLDGKKSVYRIFPEFYFLSSGAIIFSSSLSLSFRPYYGLLPFISLIHRIRPYNNGLAQSSLAFLLPIGALVGVT